MTGLVNAVPGIPETNRVKDQNVSVLWLFSVTLTKTILQYNYFMDVYC